MTCEDRLKSDVSSLLSTYTHSMLPKDNVLRSFRKLGADGMAALKEIYSEEWARNRSPTEKNECIISLFADLEEKSALDIILPELSQPLPGHLQAGRARALGKIGDARAVPAILDIMLHGRGEEARLAAALALFIIPGKDARAALYLGIASCQNMPVQFKSIDLISESGESASLRSYLFSQARRDPSVRHSCLSALSYLFSLKPAANSEASPRSIDFGGFDLKRSSFPSKRPAMQIVPPSQGRTVPI